MRRWGNTIIDCYCCSFNTSAKIENQTKREVEAKMPKKNLTLLTIFIVLPAIAHAIMPSDDIGKMNLNAQMIIVGQVKSIGKVLLPEKGNDARKGVFTLKIIHVIKGYKKIKREQDVHIIYRLPPKPSKGLTAQRVGSIPVNVKVGDLIVVYLNPSRHSGFYRPLAEGSSVIVIMHTDKRKIPQKNKKR